MACVGHHVRSFQPDKMSQLHVAKDFNY